ncbi:hypothetical protein [Streptomyces gilvus]|uniref:hypothetical protein n=1 Tax=Streptomyces gilvus TaxID=2920937 RepID=UPI001F0DFF5E|nr:hypothetical protein [Streptomyces sp. CME 23]MCH5673521.1 hypothetical protein [Streptomyces sp. CME 23]
MASVTYKAISSPDGNDGTPNAAQHETRHASPSPSATHAAAMPKATPSAQPSDLPRLDHQGDGLTGCVIRYRADGGKAGWAVFASRPGTVELTATTLTGRTYDKSWYADTSGGKTVYVTGMDVPVPLTSLKSVEGTLVDADTANTYRCLVGPGA